MSHFKLYQLSINSSVRSKSFLESFKGVGLGEILSILILNNFISILVRFIKPFFLELFDFRVILNSLFNLFFDIFRENVVDWLFCICKFQIFLIDNLSVYVLDCAIENEIKEIRVLGLGRD